MPNVNFKFDADASKVERAIKRLGTEFEKVVNTGDNIDKTLIDFGALVDKNADKVQNLKNEMQKLNAVNLQNMATQFERINAGGFNELIQGLRNVQTGVIGTENSVENLITKLGLSKNSLQQVANQMKQAMGNMSLGGEEYKATLSQINLLEQAMSRIDQNVTAGAGNTFAANQAKIASTQGYASALQQSVAQIQQSNSTIESNILQAVGTGESFFWRFREIMMKIYGEAVSGQVRLSSETQTRLFYDMKSTQSAMDVINSMMATSDNKLRLEILRSHANPEAPAFIDFMKRELSELVDKFHTTEMSYEDFMAQIQRIKISGVADIKMIKDTVLAKNEGYSAIFNMTDSKYSKVNNMFNQQTQLNVAAENMMAFAMKVTDASELTQKTLAELKGKSELEIQAISNALQRLKQAVPIESQAYKAATTQIGIINMEMQKTARANQAMAGGTSSASMAIQQLGFAVGDAGQLMNNFRGAVMGISNNMPFVIQYIMEMNASAKAAGTTGLKAFGAALTGPAGILLGINAVMFAMQVMPDLLKMIGTSSTNTAKSLKSTKDILKELNSVMLASNVMSSDTTRSVLVEGMAFHELTTRLTKTTAGTKERKVIVDQIQSTYPEYIKNIDLNKASEIELAKWVNNSTAALYGKIKAQLLSALIKDNEDAVLEASASYKRARENELKVKGSKDKGSGTSDASMYDKEGNYLGESGSMPTDKKAAENYKNRTKKELDKVTNEAKKNLTLTTSIVDEVMLALGMNPDRADTDPDALKDYNKELAGDKGKKEDEYTALEQLADKWDKIIAKEIDASKIAGLKFQKALEIWDLSQKILKTEQEKNKAEISYLNSVKEFAEYMEAVRKEKVEKLFDKASKAYEDEVKLQKMQDDTDEENLKNRIDSQEKLNELKDRTNTEGMSESEKLTFDEQKELNEIMLDDYGDKEARMTQVKKYHAKLRAKLEQTSWENQMTTVSNFLASVGDMFKKNTLAYKAMAIASATIDTYKAANVALSSPLGAPWNFIEMAAVIAAGLGNVASIIDTEITGYAKGGLITSPHLGLVGEAGAEIIAPVRDFQSYSRELIQSAYGGMGGGKELSVTVKGSDLVFTLQKATKKVNRQKVGGSL